MALHSSVAFQCDISVLAGGCAYGVAGVNCFVLVWPFSALLGPSLEDLSTTRAAPHLHGTCMEVGRGTSTVAESFR